MPGLPMPDLLAPSVLNRTVVEIEVLNTHLQSIVGGPMMGGDSIDIGGRNFAWDIADPTREIATSRAPGTGPSQQKPKRNDWVTGRFPRAHESIKLDYEQIHNQRPIGGPVSEIDRAGRQFIARQQMIIKQRFANLIEFQIAAMLRGKYYYSVDGDDLINSFSSGDVTVDYRIPAGNLLVGASFAAGLDPLGEGNIIDATWAATSTKIIEHLYKIDDAMTRYTGGRLAHVITTSKVMMSIFNNTQVQQFAGTSVSPFETVQKLPGEAGPAFFMRLRGCDWIKFHVVNESLNLNGTATRMIPEGYCSFLPEISSAWYEYWNGSEIVVPWVGQQGYEAYGMHFWAKPIDEPAGYKLMAVHNGIPALLKPKSIMFARVQND